MYKKLRQVTDTIHETIYLSQLESEMIATPYFYRLHDVYQTSTVYMTFPSNRTKRYEHSLGTMELASSMLFSAVSNAADPTHERLFQALRYHFEEIVQRVVNDTSPDPQYIVNSDKIKRILNKTNFNQHDEIFETIVKGLIEAVESGFFSDSALDHFQFYPAKNNETERQRNSENYFLYRCLLQSVRIVALFHDVGHPPYSHIIEEVLEQLYAECSGPRDSDTWNKKHLDAFMRCLEPYATKDPGQAYQCRTYYNDSSLIGSKLHERIGLKMLQSAFRQVISQILLDLASSNQSDSCKIAGIIYHIMVVEFASSILVEKNIFFKSFHKIVDGPLDADRLDYIMRDSLNSGINWGTIPYKRLVHSAKLVCLSDPPSSEGNDAFAVAYPQKLREDIEDILLMRYKIFSKINFHHRCQRTAFVLKASVLELAENFLKSSDSEPCVNPDISTLWESLSTAIGALENRVIQWNDSWLISVLHKSLINLNTDPNAANQYAVLKENLEEILLNKKRYYSLFRRGGDSLQFVKKVFQLVHLTNEELEALKSKKGDFAERLLRAEESGDLETLCQANVKIAERIEDIFRDMKDKGKLSAYKVIIHKARGNMGLPSHKDVLEEIYLFSPQRPFPLNENISLLPQLEALKKNTLWLYIYLAPADKKADIPEFMESLLEDMAKAAAEEIRESLETELVKP